MQSSKVDKPDAKIREHSIKSFKSDKLKSFDMFEASFKSSPVKKNPKLISDVHMADKSAKERFEILTEDGTEVVAKSCMLRKPLSESRVNIISYSSRSITLFNFFKTRNFRI